MICLTAEHRQILRFACVGVVNTCADFAIFWCLVTQVGTGLVQANGIAFTCAVCLGYVLNKRFTFAGRQLYHKNRWASLAAYFCVALAALGGSSYVLVAISRHGSIPAGKLAGTMVSFLVNYMGTRAWVFRRAPSERD